MKINLVNLENVLKKATLNFSIETLQLRLSDTLQADMRSNDGNSIALLNIPNDVLDTDEEITFNFTVVSQNVMPFIGLFDNDEIDVDLYEGSAGAGHMILIDGRQKSRISFCYPTVPKRLGTDDVKQDVDWFFEFDVDEEFMGKFEKIKKIGARFGNVILEIKENQVFLETADKSNQHSNSLKFHLDDIEKEDLSLCFSYKDMVNLMNVLDIEKKFKAKFTYDVDNELGMIYVYADDNSEKYCLLSLQQR
jgi:hypothetical protein